MRLRETDHDWRRASESKKTTWICERCRCTRISKEHPPPFMKVVFIEERWKQRGRGVRGPRPGEVGLNCQEMQTVLAVKLVHES